MWPNGNESLRVLQAFENLEQVTGSLHLIDNSSLPAGTSTDLRARLDVLGCVAICDQWLSSCRCYMP